MLLACECCSDTGLLCHFSTHGLFLFSSEAMDPHKYSDEREGQLSMMPDENGKSLCTQRAELQALEDMPISCRRHNLHDLHRCSSYVGCCNDGGHWQQQ